MLTFFLVLALSGAVAAYVVIDSESTQRAMDAAKSRRGETATDAKHADDDVASTDVDDDAAASHRAETPVVADPAADARPDEDHERSEVNVDTEEADETDTLIQALGHIPDAAPEDFEAVARSASRPRVADVAEPRTRARRRPVHAPSSRTAVEGPYRYVARAPWYRRILSAVGLVGVIFGVTLATTLAVFVLLAIAAEVLTNAV